MGCSCLLELFFWFSVGGVFYSQFIKREQSDNGGRWKKFFAFEIKEKSFLSERITHKTLQKPPPRRKHDKMIKQILTKITAIHTTNKILGTPSHPPNNITQKTNTIHKIKQHAKTNNTNKNTTYIEKQTKNTQQTKQS